MSNATCTAARRDVAADITAKILASLGQGLMPWRKPWDGARAGLALPRRVGGEPYRGVNTIMLWHASAAHGYASPYWLTFNQAIKLGAHVRKGERGELVVYYGSAKHAERAADGTEIETAFRFLKSYAAFNADQIEGLPERFHPRPREDAPIPLDAHERWFARLDIDRILTRDIACYIPSRDVIGMPPLAAFDSDETYAATLNHEAVHATAAPHRVGRDLSKRFQQAIAAEELVAEIGAAILGAHLNLPPDHICDHAAYIENWMSILRSDKRAFFHAAARAQAAVDWLLAKSPAPEAAHVQA
ncbi:MAG: antirestriction protein [Alphaproteobacteria bacterium]|nr:MAG: antirestriction protein [Alphaproteobacteria bacterium]